jgi:type VII secretion protein EccB
MPAQVTTRAQVNGYRFLIRRLEHALIRADSRMIHDPMRGQMRALVVGLVVAVLISGAAGVLAFFKPAPSMGDAQILLSKSNGSLYVRIGDRLHPVLNVASARLISGRSDVPKQVDDKFLNTLPLGPAVGIVGAPTSIHGGDDLETSSWTVCDTTATPGVGVTTGSPSVETTVLANDPVLTDDIRVADASQMILARSDGAVFLVYDGVRAPIDVSDAVVAGALHLGGQQPRDVSPGLLNAFPLVDPIVPVTIPDAGTPAPYLPPEHPIGSIVTMVDSRGEQLYLVLRDGLQPISQGAADIVRYSDQRSNSTAPTAISPAVLSRVPVVHTLNVDHYPASSPRLVDVAPDSVVCMSWQRANSAAQATNRLLIGHRLPLPNGAQPVRLASADGAGPGVDDVYLTPGTGEFVQSTGSAPDSRAAGQLFYVSDTGLRFHVSDRATAAALGAKGFKENPESAEETPQRAPWPVLALLPAGPELSQQAALIAHDGMAADPGGERVALPR